MSWTNPSHFHVIEVLISVGREKYHKRDKCKFETPEIELPGYILNLEKHCTVPSKHSQLPQSNRQSLAAIGRSFTVKSGTLLFLREFIS